MTPYRDQFFLASCVQRGLLDEPSLADALDRFASSRQRSLVRTLVDSGWIAVAEFEDFRRRVEEYLATSEEEEFLALYRLAKGLSFPGLRDLKNPRVRRLLTDFIPRAEPRHRIHTVVSCEDNDYQYWQAELLAHSFFRSGMTGDLTLLVATEGAAPPTHDFSAEVVTTHRASPHPETGDDYAAYNKPASLLEWFSNHRVDAEQILILDPDCIFLRPVLSQSGIGYPRADSVHYMDTTNERGSRLIQKHCRTGSQYAFPAVIPVLIEADDLRMILPRWLEATEEIRNDPESRDLAGWVAEMWGYVIAAAESGLVHLPSRFSAAPMDATTDCPIIHYCFDVDYGEGGYHWGKRTYAPWSKPEPLPREANGAARALLEILEEKAARCDYMLLNEPPAVNS
ncbi:hypothetical protein Pan216_20410 [Planctomycetes bacterium Pan216]|uniref:Hydroxyproline O-arabinosyltransferase-like domain-containing protein n=1 Tax=Kolteria novifilia TaxID=2527975 RepID=A0A518B2H6_9BACT|nr:hypothetical protein Pan216_20410 [Planctomycetes bacterium Pan216]